MKRGRLSRQGRIFRNFLLAGVLGALIWTCAGWPVPARWELRRLEREAFLSPHSQFQGSIQDSEGEEVLVGLTPRWLVMGGSGSLYLWPREGDGPVLAPVPGVFGLLGGTRVVAADTPQGTVSARLTLRAPCLWRWEDGREESQTLRFSAEGERDAHGVVSFLVQADSLEGKMALCALMGGVGYEAAADNHWVRTCQDVQADYRLEFWDAAGAPLPSAQGMLSGEAQKFPS